MQRRPVVILSNGIGSRPVEPAPEPAVVRQGRMRGAYAVLLMVNTVVLAVVPALGTTDAYVVDGTDVSVYPFAILPLATAELHLMLVTCAPAWEQTLHRVVPVHALEYTLSLPFMAVASILTDSVHATELFLTGTVALHVAACLVLHGWYVRASSPPSAVVVFVSSAFVCLATVSLLFAFYALPGSGGVFAARGFVTLSAIAAGAVTVANAPDATLVEFGMHSLQLLVRVAVATITLNQ